MLPRAVDASGYQPPPASVLSLWRAYRLRWKRRRLLLRAFRKRRELKPVVVRTGKIRSDSILAFATIRNEEARLPHWLDWHRRLGVDHFLIVDNGSEDGGPALLSDADDVSVWRTGESYRGARFGMDWINHLLATYGHGRWCLTLDADELFLYPHHDSRNLRELTAWMEGQERESYGALMLELYPKGPLGAQRATGSDPLAELPWFDPHGYRTRVQPRMGNLWIQGGPRSRVFFADDPDSAPTLNKLPLVRWHWRYAYLNSTHSLLPPRLNDRHEDGHGLILHTKFLPGVTARAEEEKARGEHFGLPDRFAGYYDALAAGPDLWHEGSVRFEDWRQAEDLGLLSRGRWE